MTLSRYFLLTGAFYLIAGITLGSYMGASGDHSLSPVHAHINLLGFTLMTVFGLSYRLIPDLAQGWMGRAHFWLHQIGSLALLTGLFLMLSGRAAEATVGPMLAPFEGAILLGALIWAVNLWRRAR